MGLIKRELDMEILMTEAYLDTVGDPEKYRLKLAQRFPSIKFVISKKVDSLFPIVSGASIVAKVTRDRALREWLVEETGEDINRDFGSGYPGGKQMKLKRMVMEIAVSDKLN